MSGETIDSAFKLIDAALAQLMFQLLIDWFWQLERNPEKQFDLFQSLIDLFFVSNDVSFQVP